MVGILKDLLELASMPIFWKIVTFGLCYAAFMSYIDTLDAPTDKSSKAYVHFFKWANRFSWRMKRAERALHIAPKTEVMSADDVKKMCEPK